MWLREEKGPSESYPVYLPSFLFLASFCTFRSVLIWKMTQNTCLLAVLPKGQYTSWNQGAFCHLIQQEEKIKKRIWK